MLLSGCGQLTGPKQAIKMVDYVIEEVVSTRCLGSVACLSRANGKSRDLLESLKNFSAHNDQICLRLFKIITHVLRIVLD